MIIAESSGLTDVGQRRKDNEDYFIIDDKLKLYVVADGMGGHAAGEVASRTAAKAMQKHIKKTLSRSDADQLKLSSPTMRWQTSLLLDAIASANKNVLEASQKKSACAGMGTTLSALLISEDLCFTANVGDSSIFLIRDGRIFLRTTTHTFAAQLAASDPDAEIAEAYHHILTRAVGTKESVQASSTENNCKDGDVFVMCSDGLTDKVSRGEICEIVCGLQSPDTICRDLVNMANERGGEDNITVITTNIKQVPDPEGLADRAKKLVTRIFKDTQEQ